MARAMRSHRSGGYHADSRDAKPPASLRPNYFAELKTCGDELFRLNQFWEFISTEGNEELEKTLSETLNSAFLVPSLTMQPIQ